MIYNIDYSAAEGSQAKIVAVTGFPTAQGASGAAQPEEGVLRLTAASAADLNALGDPVKLALLNFKSKAAVAELPADADIAIWDLLEKPKKKPAQKKATEELTSGVTDGTSADTATQGDKPGKAGKKMATKKKAAKKKVAAKARKAPSGEVRGAKMKMLKGMLERKSGCTRAEILEKTGWPAVSVQAIAKGCGLKLRQEKVEGTETKRAHTRYYGS